MDTTTDKDVVARLTEDHERIRTLWRELEEAAPSERTTTLMMLTRLLAAHEVAEEEVVYPALRAFGVEADIIADKRIAEQAQAERLLSTFERIGMEAPEGEALLWEIRDAVLAHAEAEEQEVFPLLRERLDDNRRRMMGRMYVLAKSMAPTHPHPDAPDTPPGNIMLGPLVAGLDRARDFVQSVRRR